MQQRLTYKPGPTHAYEARWTCVATANPFLASYSQAQYACPVLDLGRAHKDTFWVTG